MTSGDEKRRSCIDCNASGCDRGSKYPDFCITTNSGLDDDMIIDMYSEEDKSVMVAAAVVEHEGYRRWCRVKEVIEFSKRMGYRKIGIATCAGLISESRTLASILRSHGFEVVGVACKVGAVDKTEIGIDPICCDTGRNMCNPIMQAKILNDEKTDINLLAGLCVGHDCLFIKYSDAPVTPIIVKDRVLANNPVGALYTANTYYSDIKGQE